MQYNPQQLIDINAELKVIVLSSTPSQFVSDDDEVIIIFPEGRGAGVERV